LLPAIQQLWHALSSMNDGLNTAPDLPARVKTLAQPLGAPAAAYSERLQAAVRQTEILERKSAVLANLRALTFVAAAVLAALTFFGKLPRPVWLAAGACAAAYVVLVVAHDRVLRLKRRFSLLARVNQRGMARLTGDWHRFAERGDQFRAADHLYSEDLDIFGQGSLFQLVNETGTRFGEAVLAQWLASGATAAEVLQRQGAIRELAGLIDFRQELIVECQLASEEKADPRVFIAWAEGGPYLRTISWARPLAWLIPATTVALLVAGQLGLVPPYVWLASVFVAFLLGWLTRGPIEDFYSRISAGEMGFVRFERAFERIDAQSFRHPLLTRLAADLAGDGASMQLRRFARLFAWAEVRQSRLLHPVIDALALWDLHVFFQLEKWRAQVGARVRRWFQSLAELEALMSLAALAHDRPAFVFAELEAASPFFVARQLGHPLLDNPVRNDVELPGPRQALIITGSNMSGKSTLLRAMGANAVLALAGAPVCATSLQISELRVLTSMRVRDSLELGISHFYAEVKRIKALLDAAATANGRALFLLDEILWGTNTEERQIASRHVLRLLLATGASGAVSTHDLSLASLERELGPEVRNYHFKDLLTDGRMTFDYRLRRGVLETTNALRVLRQEGIEIPED
jgi:hypothetical protein